MLKITAAQLNFTIGDLAGNVSKMVAAASKAWTDQSDIVVFSEMSLTAYYPGDMLEEEGFMDRVDAALLDLLLASRQIPNLYWVIGLPARREAPGKKLRNSLCVIKGGEVLLEYAKNCCPPTTSSTSAGISSPARTWPRSCAYATPRWAC